jgi:DNA-binding MarR family transcriptional regulator
MRTMDRARARPRESDLERLVEEVALALPELFRELAQLQRQGLEGTGLARSHLGTLFSLLRRPECTMHELAEHRGVSMPNLTPLVNGLIARRMVLRSRDRRDRRRVLVHLAPGGVRFIDRYRRRIRAVLRQRLDVLGRDDRARLLSAVAGMRHLLRAGPPQPAAGEVRRRMTRAIFTIA